jgi:hypothetical protein
VTTLAWGLAATTAAVVAFTLYLHSRIGGDWTLDLVLFTAIVPAPVATGLLIAQRRPGM